MFVVALAPFKVTLLFLIDFPRKNIGQVTNSGLT